METTITISALVAGVGLIAVMVWRERRPADSLDVSLLPTTPLMFAGIVICLLALVHLAGLYGIELPSRR